MIIAVAAILGLLVGSFLNVVILRHGTGVAQQRSLCPACSHELAWYDLVPVVSWLLLKARCRYCSCKISAQYMVVELITATLFALIVYKFGVTLEAFAWMLVAALSVASSGYDLRHFILPDQWTIGLMVIGLAGSVTGLLSSISGHSWWMQLLAGVLAAAPFGLVWLLSKGKAIGFGDVKLMLAIGWLVYFTGAWSAIMWAAWIGVIVIAGQSVYKRYTHKRKSKRSVRSIMKMHVPFGPLLLAGMWIVILFDLDIIGTMMLNLYETGLL